MNVPVYPVRARAQQLTADSSVRKCLDFDVEVEEEEEGAKRATCYVCTCYERALMNKREMHKYLDTWTHSTHI